MKQTTIDMIVNRIAQDMPNTDIAPILSAFKQFLKENPNANKDSFEFQETDIDNINTNLDKDNLIQNSNVANNNSILGDLNQIILNLSMKPDKNKIAIDRFALLPTNRVPQPSSDLPSLQYNLPHDSASFVGREGAIEIIGGFLGSRPHPQAAVIDGMAGMGKTSLVRNIAYRYGHYFLGGIFWISCSQGKEAIQNQLVECARIMKLKTKGLNPEDTIKRVRNEWQKKAPKLIIFDDCQHPTDLDGFLPNGGGGYVIITSKYQTRGWKDRCHTIVEMGQLSRSESTKLLRSLAPHLTEAESSQIGMLLGDYPFALALAARYLHEYRTPVDEYVAEIKTASIDHDSLVGAGGFVEELPEGQRDSIIAMFELCYAQLKNQTKRADGIATVLKRLRYCAANSPVSVELLIGTPKRPQGIDAVSDVINSGLLEGTPNSSVRMHGLVAAYLAAKEDKNDPAANQAAQDAVESLLLDWAVAANDNEDIAKFSAFAPHVSAAADRALQRFDERAGEICFEWNRYLALMSQYENALKHTTHAVDIAKHLPDFDIWTHTKWLNGLGLAYLNTQNPQDAQKILDQSIYGIKDLRIGDKQQAIIYLSILNNLGILYDQFFEKYNQAYNYHSQSLEICQQYLPQNHVHLARSYNNLGAVLYMMKNWDSAFDNYKFALDIYTENYEPPHLRIAYLYFNLGEAEEQRSHIPESIDYFSKAASMFTRLYNTDNNPYTQAAQDNISRIR